MAITGTKAFAFGEKLSSSDVNQYLMRGVKVFADASTRDAAYGGSGEPVLEEGETCWVSDVNQLQVYNGSAWVVFRQVSVGQILQVVQTVKSDTFTTSSTTMTDITGLSVTITPTATSSKVLVMYSYQARLSSGANHVTRLMRDSTAIGIGDAAGSRTRGTTGMYAANPTSVVNVMQFLDSPSTTSSIVYKVQAQIQSGSMTVNTLNDDLDTAAYGRMIATITAMEVSG
jgi:hypothetical protein